MENKHNAELQRTNPGTKVTGEFSANGPYFPYDMSHAMHISRITKVTLKNYPKNLEKMTPLTVNMNFSKQIIKSLQFLMVQGSLTPNIIFLC